MEDTHVNSIALLKLSLKAGNLGYKGDFCRDVAYAMGEAGNDYPSIDAILYAENLIQKMEQMKKTGG